MKQIKRLFEIDPWKIRTTKLDKENRRLQESLTSIGNGYMGMRGNFEETYSADHHQGTYIAGVWFPDKTRVGWWKNGYPEYFGKVINAVNFLSLEILVNGQVLDLAQLDPQDFKMELDMQNGLLSRSFVVAFDDCKVRFEFERFLSIVKKELAFIHLTATVLEGEATIQINSSLDNNVTNEDSNYDERFWEEVAQGETDGFSYVTARTIANPFGVPQFTVTSAMKHNFESEASLEAPLMISNQFVFNKKQGESFTFEKELIPIILYLLR